MSVRKIDLARALGVNRSTITKAAQAGRLVLTGDDPRFFDLDASLARYQATKGGRLDVQERHAAARAASGATDQNALTVADAPRAASEPQDTAHAAATPATNDGYFSCCDSGRNGKCSRACKYLTSSAYIGRRWRSTLPCCAVGCKYISCGAWRNQLHSRSSISKNYIVCC